jgi:hypothetical protein
MSWKINTSEDDAVLWVDSNFLVSGMPSAGKSEVRKIYFNLMQISSAVVK